MSMRSQINEFFSGVKADFIAVEGVGSDLRIGDFEANAGESGGGVGKAKFELDDALRRFALQGIVVS